MNSIGSVTRRLQRMVLSSSQVRREKNVAIPPQSIFPIEIWDAILCDLPDKDLLRAACVCRAFNALCIAACLSRHSTLLHGQAPPADVIMDTFALHALRISSLQQPIQRLWCHFQNSDIFRHLAALVDFTRKSNDLRDVTVDFPVDLLAAPRLDAPSSKIPRAGSRRELLRELCAVLSVVALKTPGPVFVIAPGTVFTCRSKDVAGWRLDLLEFNGGTGPRELCKRMRRALRDKSPSHSPCPFTTVRLCSGEMWGTWAITEMHAASVRSFSPPRMLSTPYTVILLDFCSITSLHLSCAPISVALLADVLVNLTITALDTFGIVDGIDPEILGEFLLRHPHLREFHHQATAYWPWSQIVGQIPSYSSLITPPIAHPGLRVIRADSAEDLDRVMEGLHLSPLLNVFTFWHQPHATDHTFLVGLNSFFRLLSKRTNDLHLDLGIPQEVDPEQQFMDEEAADIARALHCIRSVDIVCKSTEMCLKTLPWFALFPALSSARFMLFRWWKGPQVWVDAELAGFLEQVRAALPQVEITVYPLEVVTEG